MKKERQNFNFHYSRQSVKNAEKSKYEIVGGNWKCRLTSKIKKSGTTKGSKRKYKGSVN